MGIMGDPILPFTTIVVILFMLHGRFNSFGLLLLSALFADINPFYVVIFSLFWKLLERGLSSKSRTKGNVISVAREEIPGDENGGIKVADSSGEYDYVLIGNNIG